MIVTKNELRQVLAEIAADIDAVAETMHENHGIAMSAAGAAKRFAEETRPLAAEAFHAVAANGKEIGRMYERIDATAGAVADNILAIERLAREDRRVEGRLANLEHLVTMLLEYLNVEMIYEPEVTVSHDGVVVETVSEAREYFAKRQKSRR